MTNALENIKANLIEQLREFNGDVTNHQVSTTIAQLVQNNPTRAMAQQTSLWNGHWLMLNAPNFPGGILQDDGSVVYTIGRMSFGMFQPSDLQVRIDRVTQPMLPIDGIVQYTHDIVAEVTIMQPNTPALNGFVNNLGVCQPDGDDALRVEFTGGTLEPKSDTDIAAWKQLFRDQSVRSSSLKDKFSNRFLRLMFGLVGPNPIDEATGIVTYEMRRSPKGKLQLLYLDDTLRITKGEKGTVLVCKRLD